MKKFIHVLSMSKSGTTRLAYALNCIGIDAHHEIIDIRPVYLKWMKKRFSLSQVSKLDVESAKILFQEELLKYLQVTNSNMLSDGYFADISHYLATLYPIIDNITDSMNIDTRSIHLTRSFFPHRTIVYNTYTFVNNVKISDNTIHTDRDLYYPAELSWCSDIEWKDWVTMSHFEKLCWYWKFHQEYFLEGRREIFHVEDFNFDNKSLEILKILYPEATEKQKEIFKRELFYTPESPYGTNATYTLETTDEEKEIYERICGPTLKKLGYD